MFERSRKGQIAGQIFIYVIAIVVVGFIIVYGYSAIRGFTERGQEVEQIALQKDMQNAIKGIASDFGSVKRPDIYIPGKYTYVCLVDRDKYSMDNPICTHMGEEYKDIYSPVACSGWEIGSENMFLLPDGTDSFDVGEITITRAGTPESDYICFEVIANKINMQLKGKGDKAEVSKFERQ